MLKTFTTAFVVAVSALTLGAKAPVKVRVNPRVGNAPANVTAFIKLDPNPDNRWLTVSIDNGRYGTSSLKQLWGPDVAEDLSALTVSFPKLPEGHFLLVATLQRADGTLHQVTTTFCLNGPNVSCVE